MLFIHIRVSELMVSVVGRTAPQLLATERGLSLVHKIIHHAMLRHALSHGVLHMIQVSISFSSMLVVMYVFLRRTFQVGFILSIIIGQGVGETLYGCYMDAAREAVHGH